ncbi:hypothetical protein ACFL0H_00235 [Thermodesulfobacteriota bacterium]
MKFKKHGNNQIKRLLALLDAKSPIFIDDIIYKTLKALLLLVRPG